MESSRLKRRRLMVSYIPQRPELPAIFESLNDDTLTNVLEFVGDKSYAIYAGINKHCKEIYLSSGMTKKTFLYGYAPLSVIINRYQTLDVDSFIQLGRDLYVQIADYDPESHHGVVNGATLYSKYDIEMLDSTLENERERKQLYERVGKGVVFYNRHDVLDWVLQKRKRKRKRGNKNLIFSICNLAAKEGRIDLLDKMWNNMNDRFDKREIRVDLSAARGGKLDVMKWVESKGYNINDSYRCAHEAACGGQLHIIHWLQEEKGLELRGGLYLHAARGGQLHVMKWLRDQEVPWNYYTFVYAAKKGNVEVLQWLQDEGCPWPEDHRYRVNEYELIPEARDWLISNGYGNRIKLQR